MHSNDKSNRESKKRPTENTPTTNINTKKSNTSTNIFLSDNNYHRDDESGRIKTLPKNSNPKDSAK